VLRQIRALALLEAPRVALWLPDSVDFLTAFLALAFTGKRIVLPHTLQKGACAQMAEHFDVLLTDTPRPELACEQLTLAELSGAEPTVAPSDCHTNVEITLFTSGSTDLPQPVNKTLTELEREVAVLAHDFPHVGKHPVVASVSHHHIYGLLHVLLWPLHRGAAFVSEPAQYPEILNRQLAQHGPAVWVASPTQLTRMPDSELFARATQQLHEVFSSGGLLTEAAATTFAGIAGCSPLEVLGSTETGGVAWRRQSESSLWRPLHQVELAQSPRGCLLVRSSHLALPDAFEMGDQVRELCPQGFALLGRLGSVVKVEGKRLSLTELEARLSESPWVHECRAAVVRARRDEVGVLVVLTPAGEQALQRLGKHQINSQLRQALRAFFDLPVLPRRWRYLAQLPRNSQGKVPMADVIHCLSERY
jgi:acyl-coenzyme A synthetase/AMP-(fatty) acid ligase